MSSRRKSTTPCMVLPSDVLEPEIAEDKTDGVKEKEANDEDNEEKVKEAKELGSTSEEHGQVVVVVPTPPAADEVSASAVECNEEADCTLRSGPADPPEDSSAGPSLQEQQKDSPGGGGADPAAMSAISLSKTPIMRLRTKPEPKRIAVSLKSVDEIAEGLAAADERELGGELEPIEAPLGPMTPVEMFLHDSVKFGGGSFLFSPPSEQQRKSSVLNPTVVPAGLAQVLSAFQAQQSAAATSQPQLLIPVSSIPSYSAAMDTNPLLCSAYKKFPYPSMAEIRNLAAQTQFSEEQIKVWLSAQRLKHGVSWTPEEVEEARRKQFNGTVHTVPQTITVIPAHQLSAAANGLQSILQTCQIVGQPGLMFTQVCPGGPLPVTNPITLTVTGLPTQSQSASRSCQPSPANSELKRATTIQPPSLSPQENSALSADNFNMRPKKSKEQLAELKASYMKNHFVTDAEIARLMKITNLTKGEIKKWFSDTRYNQRNSKNSHVIIFHDGGPREGSSFSSAANTPIVIDSSDETPASPHPPHTPPVKEKESRPKTWNPFPDFTLQKFKEKTPEQLVVLEESFERSSTPTDEELSRLRTETKLTRREIDAWFSERRKVPSASSSFPDSGRGKGKTDGTKTGGAEEADSCSPSASSSRKDSQTPPGSCSKRPPGCSKKEIRDKTKKTPEQLHILKCAFVRTQWPTPEEYDQLSEESGLPRPYIVSWFGDSRYSWKNGNLKWFFQYQSGSVERPSSGSGGKPGGGGGGRKRRGRNRGWGRSRSRKQPKRSSHSSADYKCPLSKKFKTGKDILKDYYLKHHFLNEQDLDELVTKTNMSYEQVREWFAEVQKRLDMGADPFMELASGPADGDKRGELGETSAPAEERISPGMGDEDDDDDAEEDDGEDTDDSEMEIFGSTFDDSMFSEARDRVCESLTSYNPKMCEAEWFCESAALETDDAIEKQKVYKFRGDLAMRKGNYQKALEAYSSCLQWIADNNLTIRRDVLEGMARCCTKLGQRDQALDLVDLLSKEASNTCHLTSLLLLKVSIHQHFGSVRSKISCLQQLCSLLPFNPWHWLSLGQVCLQLLDPNPAIAVEGLHEEEEEEEELHKDWIWLKACISFIRTRLLLRVLRQQQSSFVLQRSRRTLEITEEALRRLNPKEKTLQTLTEVMSEDLIPEKMREDFQDGESLSSVCLQGFRERWWSKVLLTCAGDQNGEAKATTLQ